VASPPLAELAERIGKVKDPREWPGVIQELGRLTMLGACAPEAAKTMLYLVQTWQVARKQADAYEEGLESQRDQVFVAKLIDGKPRKSRLAEVREYPDLWTREVPGGGGSSSGESH
jgi:hypothetical protein